MTVLVAAGCGLLGLLVGSFLNVVIHRVPRHESVVRPRSRCPGCGTTLAERDNIPVVSWLLLRGRCRTCDAPISARYPAVELLTGAAFAAVGARFGADWSVPAYLVLVAALIAVSAVDLELFLVPNRILLATLALGIPLLVLAAAVDDRWHDLGTAAVGGAIGFGVLLVINLVTPRGMGMGDVKLAGVLGAWLGFLDLGHVFLGLFLGFLLGSVGGILLLATGLRTRKDHIPFAPFLAAGAVVAILVGSPLLDWYGG
ncbi:MAG: prepilin signal peptidase PulO-like peptidase [Actinomycetia bacterium]|nr:prepilin signal peptidase PulO-like peptidase [Actinomycetes bacterium]